MTLRDYLIETRYRLQYTPTLDLFMELRYRELARLFPHDTFSVGQASLDFFDKAVAHVNGEPFHKTDEKPSMYEMNYRRWIAANR